MTPGGAASRRAKRDLAARSEAVPESSKGACRSGFRGRRNPDEAIAEVHSVRRPTEPRARVICRLAGVPYHGWPIRSIGSCFGTMRIRERIWNPGGCAPPRPSKSSFPASVGLLEPKHGGQQQFRDRSTLTAYGFKREGGKMRALDRDRQGSGGRTGDSSRSVCASTRLTIGFTGGFTTAAQGARAATS